MRILFIVEYIFDSILQQFSMTLIYEWLWTKFQNILEYQTDIKFGLAFIKNNFIQRSLLHKSINMEEYENYFQGWTKLATLNKINQILKLVVLGACINQICTCTVRFKSMNPMYNIRMYWTNFCLPTIRLNQNIFEKKSHINW